jgi:hypothetical protein
MRDQTWYNLVAISAIVGVVTVGAAALVVGSMPASGAPASAGPRTDYLYLTIAFNPSTGQDQYFPANFSVPSHTLVVVTITSYDNGTNPVPTSSATVHGTVGNQATMQEGKTGTPSTYSQLPLSHITHTFTMSQGGYALSVPIPPAADLGDPSVVSFSAYFNETGNYGWLCLAPCDQTSMGVPGLMAGTVGVL